MMKNIIVGLLFVSFIGAMEKPVPVIGDWQHFFMKQFVEADQINDFSFFSRKKDSALEEIIPLALAFMDNPKEFEELRKQLNIPKAELTQRLYNVINSAKRALELSQINVSKPEAKPIEPVIKPINPIREQLSHKMRFLYNFVEAEINGDPDNYINTRPASTYEMVIKTANNVMISDAQLELFQKAFEMSEKQVKDLITRVTKKAREALIEQASSKLKKAKPQEEKISPAPVSQPKEMPKLNIAKEAQTHFEVEFANQTVDKIVTAWVSVGNDKWEMAKLIPFKDSKKIMAISGVKVPAINIYVGYETFLLSHHEDYFLVAREFLNSTMGGKFNYLDFNIIKEFKFKIKPNAKITVIVNPDSSISIAERT